MSFNPDEFTVNVLKFAEGVLNSSSPSLNPEDKLKLYLEAIEVARKHNENISNKSGVKFTKF